MKLLHKYVDDLTVSEIFNKYEESKMNAVLSTINQWSERNLLNINCSKTKEMLLGSLKCTGIEPLYLGDNKIQSVSSFKLLGVHIDDDLKWSSHIDSVCSKANSRIYCIKLLKRSGVDVDDLLHYYYSFVRPVLGICLSCVAHVLDS
jgi:hypothetical protein